jgi:hypothetical protein
MSESLEFTAGELRSAIGNPVPEDLQRAWQIGQGPVSEATIAKMLDEAPTVPDEQPEPLTRLEKMAEHLINWRFDEFAKHPRTSIGTFFLSLTALTADIEKGITDPKIIFTQIGAVATFNYIGKKLKV